MKGTLHRLKTLFIIFSFASLTHCSVPFANGITGKDVISTINGARNISKITEAGAREEVITETKNILRDIQHGGKVQR